MVSPESLIAPRCRPLAELPADSVRHRSQPGRPSSLTTVNFHRMLRGSARMPGGRGPADAG